ncbi:uncharacterized protein LOC144567910 isoform X1 [Carex rostrata]
MKGLWRRRYYLILSWLNQNTRRSRALVRFAAAVNRLINTGVPATVEHRAAATSLAASISASAIAQCVQNSITAMDTIKLNMIAVDQIKFTSIKLAKKYMKRVANELQVMSALKKDPALKYQICFSNSLDIS